MSSFDDIPRLKRRVKVLDDKILDIEREIAHNSKLLEAMLVTEKLGQKVEKGGDDG